MNIDEARQFVNFISNKTQSGVVKTSQFNLAAGQAQLEFFNKKYKTYQQTKEVTDAISVWLKAKPMLVASNGRMSYPADYMRFSAAYRIYYMDNESILVEIVPTNNDEVGTILMSQIVQPTLKYPRIVHYDTYMQFYPKNIGSIQFNYFRTPTRPVWGYTVVNGRQVYDPATSVNMEVAEEDLGEVMMMICSFLGINLRDGDLIKFSEAMKAQGI